MNLPAVLSGHVPTAEAEQPSQEQRQSADRFQPSLGSQVGHAGSSNVGGTR